MTAQPTRHFILGTAGHVDHGKSSLVKVLTGTDPDRLPEEKARQITIDLGFGEMLLASEVEGEASYAVGVVDVPGHEDFIRNMVAGVGSIDAALLVVAADDGWMPQTEEHLQILVYLGVRAAIIALSKIDLADDESKAIAAVRGRLAHTPFASAEIIATSVLSGRGMDELKAAIVRTLAHLCPSRDIQKPRLPVDRAFALKGVGTIVTGTLIGGTVERGQQMVIQPAGIATRVRSLQNHGNEIILAVPGSRIALNLSDVHPAVDRITTPAVVRRGDVITAASAGAPGRLFCVRLERSSRLSATGSPNVPPIRSGMRVWFHHATKASPARLRLIDTAALLAGESCVAMLATKSPLFAFAGDRFILRDASQQRTLAGGCILDPHPPAGWKQQRFEQYRQEIQKTASRPGDPRPQILAMLARSCSVEKASLLHQSSFSRAEIASMVDDMLAQGEAIAAGNLILDPALWRFLRSHLLNRVRAHHVEHPEQRGLPLAEFRRSMGEVIPKKSRSSHLSTIEQTLLSDVAHDGITCAEGIIRENSHRPALPPRLREAGERVQQRLCERPFDPRGRKELCRTDLEVQAMKFLVVTCGVIELSPEIVLSTSAYERAVAMVREHLRRVGTASVSELKKVLSSSRRVMIPLLERLDRDGITQRSGDLRSLRR